MIHAVLVPSAKPCQVVLLLLVQRGIDDGSQGGKKIDESKKLCQPNYKQAVAD